ncbi:senescence-specific cysteine protease SAG39-like [Iris pallida]|uniref:Senescence-specific cysteine protease SAG39-like n=1 Tax=Iris pallida TaxID=29817 RepID=A0AAX6GUR2_IRIPA|nr:senescence-specific cysteine protease SAG39-like [Iris pallida]
MALSTSSSLCLALLILGIWSSQASASRKLTEMSMEERHEQWMARHGQVYKDEAEKDRRFEIFKTNVELIESFNAGNQKFKLGANQFADLLNEEFNEVCSGYRPPLMTTVTAAKGFMYANVTDTPSSMDWRANGAVTPVKHQGHCGSCWAFSAVASIEGLTQVRTGKLISLSDQELIDRDTSSDNQGCDGGNMGRAFEFVVSNEGLSASENYGGSFSHATTSTIGGYEQVPANDEAALLKAVSMQPVSVAIDASSYALQLYAGGVFTGYCGTELNHAVAVVGYGTESDGTKYWIVKNSWGSSWGEDGYIRIQRDVGDKEGLCGIAMQASYPTA